VQKGGRQNKTLKISRRNPKKINFVTGLVHLIQTEYFLMRHSCPCVYFCRFNPTKPLGLTQPQPAHDSV